MKPFSLPSLTIAFMFATFMSLRGRKRKSLTKGGSICAFLVGFLGLACGLRGFLLLLFYVVSCVYFTIHFNLITSYRVSSPVMFRPSYHVELSSHLQLHAGWNQGNQVQN